MAETIVEEMFINSGYEVHRFGMENMVPGLIRKLNGNKSYVSTQIRTMPDFVVHYKDQVHFVEVKFKRDGYFDINDLQKDKKIYPYSDCIIIVISRDRIKALSVEELSEGKSIRPDCKNFLGNRKEFSLNKDVIVSYLKIVKIFFNEIPARLDDQGFSL